MLLFSATHIQKRSIRFFIWTVTSILVFLISCQQIPSNEIQIDAKGCNVHTLLIENPAYLPHKLKLPTGPNPYKDLFKKGFMYGCAVSLWDDVDPQRSKENLRGKKERFFSLVKINSSGVLEALDKIEGTSKPILQFPNYPIQNARLHIYIVPPSIGGDLQGFRTLCEEQMKLKSFKCFSPANRSTCLFYFQMIPKFAPERPYIQVYKSSKRCNLCAPEICDGQDNDCDGKKDNLYGSTAALQRACYTGPKLTLIDEKRGVGICAIGQQSCTGSWGTCLGQQIPKAKEECNNLDDNCDGVVDEGNLCSKGYICKEGKCVVTPCREDQVSCGSICVLLESDPKNCGQCGKACADGELCAQGRCVTSCPSSTPTVCGNRSCIHVDTNRDNCGRCGNACKDGFICFKGKCTLSCPSTAPQCGSGASATCCSLGCCNGQCVDFKTNPLHCGGCKKRCASGNLCFQGACRIECPSFAPKCGVPGRELCCDKQCCKDTCVDTQSDPYNCGSCGLQCKPGERCDKGECKLSCPTTAPKCGPPEKETCCALSCCNDACIDIQNDRNHCGACGRQCPSGFRCSGGQCILSCPASAPQCGAPGQETCCALNCCNNACVDTLNDPLHCGGCGNICPSGQVCQKGTCGFLCPPAQRLCGNFCIDIRINPKHCGGCNQVCGPGERCEQNQCKLCPRSAPACGQAGQKTCCALNCCNNACVDIKNNPNHCGACGNRCATGERCNNGVCQLCPNTAPKCGASCCSNTCCGAQCVDTTYHPLHCGACGNVCSNGKTCCNGRCIDLRKSKTHCGQCDQACSGNQRCDQGVCCANNQSACGGKCFNLQNDKNHCGACGNVCPQGQICQTGQCVCPNNQTKCGSICVDTQSNNKHCGACGTVCPTNQTCIAGKCTCPTGQIECGGVCINPQTHNRHCSVCGNACTDGRTCQSGQCLCPPGTNQCGSSCVNLETDNQHCGGCGNPCSTGNTCCASNCVNTQTDSENCGACGTKCTAGQSCTNGTCN